MHLSYFFNYSKAPDWATNLCPDQTLRANSRCVLPMCSTNNSSSFKAERD